MRRRAILIFSVFSMLLQASESTRTVPLTREQEKFNVTKFWNPYLLYTTPHQYRSLVVEIDAVDGSVPRTDYVAALQQFLQPNCGKPDGVRVYVDDIIPPTVALTRTSTSLALEHINGPPDENTAFLYILIYNSSIMKDRSYEPHFTALPYPAAVFIDLNYSKILQDDKTNSMKYILFHEAGHAIGLCHNEAHSDGIHCKNTGCLMQPKSVVHYSESGESRMQHSELCQDYRPDVQAYTRLQNPYLGVLP